MSSLITKVYRYRRRRRRSYLSSFHLSAQLSTATTDASPSPSPSPSPSKLYTKYNFKPPLSLKPQPPLSLKPQAQPSPPTRAAEFTPPKPPPPPYRPPSSLDRTGQKPARTILPFDFTFSYTESYPARPIGLREPKYSPFGPARIDRVWTGVCAPVVDPKQGNLDIQKELQEKRFKMFQDLQGEPLTEAERKQIVLSCHKSRTRSQQNLGRNGLTHNMLNDIHNCWKRAEAIRINCMGVPTVDMKNVCYQLEDKTFGKIILRRGRQLVLYRGRNYNPKKIPDIPLMLWKPRAPIHPRLLDITIDGLSRRETKEMRKKGLAVPISTKLAKNGYYANLVRMVRDGFLTNELVRIDCEGLPTSDYKKIGLKLRDLVPCILVTFDKEQIVVWRGKDYKPMQGGYFFTEMETFDDTPHNNISSCTDEEEFEDTRT